MANDYLSYRLLACSKHTGALSYANVVERTSLSQTNCSLTTTINQSAVEFPVSLLLLLTGLVLVILDLNVSFLLCTVKWKRCSVLVIAWFLVTTVCMATWTVWCLFYLGVVYPVWLEDRSTCDYLVMIVTSIAVGVFGLLTLIYVIVIFVVIAYDCNRWCNLRSF